MQKSALIIFVRNPLLGKVKTRLAQTIGNEKALLVYLELLKHTAIITQDLPCDKYVYYADYINEADGWDNAVYRKRIQQGNDLGQRMQHAFSALFDEGYTSALIIGSDCYELTKQSLNNAFDLLQSSTAVIGPAADGGYYTLGLQKMIPELFEHIAWSTPEVLTDTIALLKAGNCTYQLLPVLNDIDDEADLTPELKTKAGIATGDGD